MGGDLAEVRLAFLVDRDCDRLECAEIGRAFPIRAQGALQQGAFTCCQNASVLAITSLTGNYFARDTGSYLCILKSKLAFSPCINQNQERSVS